MLKCTRLKRLKKLRRMRDEIFDTDNVGRATHLLFNMPGVSSVVLDVYGHGTRTSCEVMFNDGYEFIGYGGLREIEAIRKVTLKVYLKSQFAF